jgi:hypothetical protein
MLYTPKISIAAEQGEPESSSHVLVTCMLHVVWAYYYSPSPALCKHEHVVASLVIISSFPAATHALSSDVRGPGETRKSVGAETRKTMHEERRRTRV